MKKRKSGPPPPYAQPTRDTRFEGTFEVMVPVAGRVRPHRVALTFETLGAAESWIHSPDGEDAIAAILKEAAGETGGARRGDALELAAVDCLLSLRQEKLETVR
jgi:hypothetical protein